jgi:hypothetical protein
LRQSSNKVGETPIRAKFRRSQTRVKREPEQRLTNNITGRKARKKREVVTMSSGIRTKLQVRRRE